MKVYYAKLEFEPEAKEVLFYKGVISPLFSEREYAEQWGRDAMEKEFGEYDIYDPEQDDYYVVGYKPIRYEVIEEEIYHCYKSVWF